MPRPYRLFSESRPLTPPFRHCQSPDSRVSLNLIICYRFRIFLPSDYSIRFGTLQLQGLRALNPGFGISSLSCCGIYIPWLLINARDLGILEKGIAGADRAVEG